MTAWLSALKTAELLFQHSDKAILLQLLWLIYSLIVEPSTQTELEQIECLHSEIPPPPHDYPILVIHIRSEVKTRQSYKFKKMPKIQQEIWQETLHTTHFLNLLNKMYKYDKDPTRTAGTTEGTLDDRRTDWWSETNIPPTTSLCGGYNKKGFLSKTLQFNSGILTLVN